MARNGSGSYSLPVNSWNPALNGVPATAADYQALINDIAQALTQSVSRDGQSIMTGNLPMGGNKLTGLGPATAAGDSLRFEQLFSQGLQADLASAATTDIGSVLTTVVNITGTATITSFGANYNGPRYVRFAGACTLTNSASLVLPGGANLTVAAGDSAIVVPLGNPATGWRVFAYQRASGAAFDGSVNTASIQDDAVTFPKLQNVATATILGRSTAGTGDVEALTGAQATALLSAASETVSGRVELADATEAQAQTDSTRALSPARLASALQGSNQSLSANGYQRLPGGLIVQWGSIASTSGSWPIAFPNAVLWLSASPWANNSNGILADDIFMTPSLSGWTAPKASAKRYIVIGN